MCKQANVTEINLPSHALINGCITVGEKKTRTILKVKGTKQHVNSCLKKLISRYSSAPQLIAGFKFHLSLPMSYPPLVHSFIVIAFIVT